MSKIERDRWQSPRAIAINFAFYPIIAEFVSDDFDIIEARKQAIEDAEWRRAARFAQAKLREPGFTVRDGSPIKSGSPSKPLSPIGTYASQRGCPRATQDSLPAAGQARRTGFAPAGL